MKVAHRKAYKAFVALKGHFPGHLAAYYHQNHRVTKGDFDRIRQQINDER